MNGWQGIQLETKTMVLKVEQHHIFHKEFVSPFLYEIPEDFLATILSCRWTRSTKQVSVEASEVEGDDRNQKFRKSWNKTVREDSADRLKFV